MAYKNLTNMFLLMLLTIQFGCEAERSSWMTDDLIFIQQTDPVEQAKIAIKNKDLRFLLVGGVAAYAPGVFRVRECVIDEASFTWKTASRFIDGTGDSFEHEQHKRMHNAAVIYAKSYNIVIAKHVISKGVKSCHID